MSWPQRLARLPLDIGARVMPEGGPVVRQLVLAGIDRTFGAAPFDPDRHAGDTGLHGPGSAPWQVLGEPAAIIGGVRGVLVQLLHPMAMAGVADHSAYERDLLGRLHRTSLWVAGTAFGPLDDLLAMARFVRRRHRPVRGAAPDGHPYRADDPRLLAWVSLALTESFLATDMAYAPTPVRGAAADAFVREQSRVAALLDPRVDLDAIAPDPDGRSGLRDGTLPLPMIEEGTLPVDLVGLRSAIATYEGEPGVNHQGRAALAFLQRPAQLDGRPAHVYPAVLGGALATIPAHRRRVCGISISPRRERALWGVGWPSAPRCASAGDRSPRHVVPELGSSGNAPRDDPLLAIADAPMWRQRPGHRVPRSAAVVNGAEQGGDPGRIAGSPRDSSRPAPDPPPRCPPRLRERRARGSDGLTRRQGHQSASRTCDGRDHPRHRQPRAAGRRPGRGHTLANVTLGASGQPPR